MTATKALELVVDNRSSSWLRLTEERSGPKEYTMFTGQSAEGYPSEVS